MSSTKTEARRRYRQRRAARLRNLAQMSKTLPNRAQRRGKAKARPRRSSPQVVIYGRGDYKTTLRNGAKAVAKSAAASAGEIAMDALLGLVGFGGYKHAPIRKNSMIGAGKGNLIDFGGQNPPMVMNNGDGSTIVNHREMVGELLVGTDGKFHYQKFGLNPANESFFPWLSKIAANYQQWELSGCVVELKSMASSYANNVTLGTLWAGVQYNYYAPDPRNMRELANLDGSCTAKSDKNVILPIECARRLTTIDDLYIDNPGLLAEGDERFNYMGNIFVGYEGVKQNTAPVDGEKLVLAQIWVSYEVRLMKPILTDATGVFNTLKLNADDSSSDHPWGTLKAQGAHSSIQWSVPDGGTALVLDFPPVASRYLCTLAWTNPNASSGPVNVGFGLTVNDFILNPEEFPGATGTTPLPTNTARYAVASTPITPGGNFVASFILDVPEDPLDDAVPQALVDFNNSVSGAIAGITFICTAIDPSV